MIEDEELVRFSLYSALDEAGHDVFEAADGVEGVSEFKKMVAGSLPPDVIITDLLMPEKHGYETITEILKIAPGTKFIAISGGGDVDPKVFLDISQALGVKQVLAKPFTDDALIDAVNVCLG
ncbi:MAG: response regulator [Rhodospirillales bacterium]|nr:response regulator [Rhodospirillales bacterium]